MQILRVCAKCGERPARRGRRRCTRCARTSRRTLCRACSARPPRRGQATCKRCERAAERPPAGRPAATKQRCRGAGPPCPYPPGTAEKVAWMALRAVEGRPLFSAQDATGEGRRDMSSNYRLAGRNGRAGQTTAAPPRRLNRVCGVAPDVATPAYTGVAERENEIVKYVNRDFTGSGSTMGLPGVGINPRKFGKSFGKKAA